MLIRIPPKSIEYMKLKDECMICWFFDPTNKSAKNNKILCMEFTQKYKYLTCVQLSWQSNNKFILENNFDNSAIVFLFKNNLVLLQTAKPNNHRIKCMFEEAININNNNTQTNKSIFLSKQIQYLINQ